MPHQKPRRANIDTLGQVFTPPEVVRAMLALRENRGRILEPSAGRGAFLRELEADAVGVELDAGVVAAGVDGVSNAPGIANTRSTTDTRVHIGDFFAYPVAHKFETIIGNPPYVRFQNIPAATRALLPMEWFDRRSNLYLFFIAKCMRHLPKGGELIFITPRDFLKSTNAKRLNAELYAQGCITHFADLGDRRIFDGFTPNCAIWRWQRGRASRATAMGNAFCHRDGQIWFGETSRARSLGEFFDVRVGAVSGADPVFANARHANVKMVCSRTRKDGYERGMIYNKRCKYLERFKSALLSRKIRKFDESNWWQWGRAYHRRSGPRIYVNCKTRQAKPFFASDTEAYDGSVLALFPKCGDAQLGKVADALNKVDWQSLGFVCGGRLLFTQKSLQNAPVAV